MAAASFKRSVWLQSTAQLSVKNRHTSLFNQMSASNRDEILVYLNLWRESERGKKKQIGVPCENREIIHGYVDDTAHHLTLTAIR